MGLLRPLLGVFVTGILVVPAVINCGGDDSSGKNGGPNGSSSGANGKDAGNVLAGPVGTLATWTTGAGRKVQPTTAAATTNEVKVTCVRDAYVGSQLVVSGDAGHLEGVSAGLAGDLSDGAGHTLSKTEVALYREVNIDFGGIPKDTIVGNSPVATSSPTKDTNVPDPLVPLVDPESGKDVGEPFNVAQNTNVPLFVDVHVPKGLAAGDYKGTIHVAAAAGGFRDVPITVTVENLDLPDMRSVTAYFKMSINDLLQFHGGVAACSGADCYLDVSKPETKALIKRYEDLAHSHRIDIGQANVYPPVDKCKIPSDSDWASYDAAMQPYMDGSYFTDKVPSSRFDVPFAPGQTFGVDQDCDDVGYKALAAAWAAHLQSKGWFPTPSNGGFGAVAYAFDEPMAAGGDVNPVLAKIVKDSTNLQASVAGSPSPWKSHIIDTVAPIASPSSGPATTPLLDPALGVYVVNLPQFGAGYQPYYGRAEWAGLFGKGLQLWFYESNSVPPPYPTFATDTLDGNEPVIMMWGSWFEKATGFLYWDISHWDLDDPWGVETTFGKTGDGVLIYPGNHDGQKAGKGSPSDVSYDGPIASYRLKMIRQGLQDWALLKYADSKGVAVQDQVKKVYTQLGGTTAAPAGSPYWITDDAAIDTARAAIVSAILSH
jgi:hypothetical protein